MGDDKQALLMRHPGGEEPGLADGVIGIGNRHR
jgi:hypothetical protein